MSLSDVEDSVHDILEAAPTDAALGAGSSVVRHHKVFLARNKEWLLILPDGLYHKAVLVLGLLLLLLLLL